MRHFIPFRLPVATAPYQKLMCQCAIGALLMAGSLSPAGAMAQDVDEPDIVAEIGTVSIDSIVDIDDELTDLDDESMMSSTLERVEEEAGAPMPPEVSDEEMLEDVVSEEVTTLEVGEPEVLESVEVAAVEDDVLPVTTTADVSRQTVVQVNNIADDTNGQTDENSVEVTSDDGEDISITSTASASDTQDTTQVTTTAETNEVVDDGAPLNIVEALSMPVIASDAARQQLNSINQAVTASINDAEFLRAGALLQNYLSGFQENVPTTEVLRYLLDKTDLAESLALSSDKVTLFAPTDAAFFALPGKTLELLLDPENAVILRTVLLSHVLGNPVAPEQLGALDGLVKTAASNTLYIMGQEESGKALLNFDTRIVGTKTTAEGHTVYIIDKVLVPDVLANAVLQAKQAAANQESDTDNTADDNEQVASN